MVLQLFLPNSIGIKVIGFSTNFQPAGCHRVCTVGKIPDRAYLVPANLSIIGRRIIVIPNPIFLYPASQLCFTNHHTCCFADISCRICCSHIQLHTHCLSGNLHCERTILASRTFADDRPFAGLISVSLFCFVVVV